MNDEAQPAPAVLFKRRPTAMMMDRCVEPEGGHIGECDTEDCGPPCTKTEADLIEEKIKEGLVQEGFDEEQFNKWLEELNTSWEDLLTRQEEERTVKAQDDVREAADHAKAFLDTLLHDARAQVTEHNAQWYEDMKAQIDEMRA